MAHRNCFRFVILAKVVTILQDFMTFLVSADGQSEFWY